MPLAGSIAGTAPSHPGSPPPQPEAPYDEKQAQLYTPTHPGAAYAPAHASPSAAPQPAQQQIYVQPAVNAPLAQQPTAVAPMVVGAGGGGGTREFTHGLIGSCSDDTSTCCVACWCPCITYGKNVTRLQSLRDRGQPHPSGGDGCGSDCWVHCLLTSCLGVGWVMQIISRGNTRARYNIGGSTFKDCCAVCWCTPCELTQESLELAQEERQFRKQGPGAIA